MANKIPQDLLKIKKINVMVMFLSMNGVNNYALQNSNAHVHHKKQPSVIYK